MQRLKEAAVWIGAGLIVLAALAGIVIAIRGGVS